MVLIFLRSLRGGVTPSSEPPKVVARLVLGRAEVRVAFLCRSRHQRDLVAEREVFFERLFNQDVVQEIKVRTRYI